MAKTKDGKEEKMAKTKDGKEEKMAKTKDGKEEKMAKTKDGKEEESPMLTCKIVQNLLRNKFVVIVGDSIQRGIYKDLVALLHRNSILTGKEIKMKGEPDYLGDELIEGGMKGAMNNGLSYTEVRQFLRSSNLVRFYFVTRCYNAYVESILRDLEDGPKPDLVIMNSCLWDITRYGTSAIVEYKENMALLFSRLRKAVPEDCLVVWNATLPISKQARGGFLVKEVPYNNQTLRMDVLEANYFARQIVVKHGFDILDLHFWFRHRLDWRVSDGIHWNSDAHRYLSEILLSHVAHAWGHPFPAFQLSSRRTYLKEPDSSSSTTDVPRPHMAMATRLNGQPARRGNSRLAQRGNANRRSVTMSRRPAPYPVFSQSPQQRFSRHNQGNERRVSYSSTNSSSPYRGFSRFPTRQNGRPPLVPNFSAQNFRRQWSPYGQDDFRGSERRPSRSNRSRNTHY